MPVARLPDDIRAELRVENYSDDAVQDERRHKVMELYLKKRPMNEIATTLNMAVGTVHKDIHAVRDMWRSRALADYSELQQKELDEIDLLERTYWESWQRSLTAKVQHFKRTNKRGDKVDMSASETTIQTTGDPRYLEGIQWCIDKRCAILGLNAPTRNLNLNVTVMSDDELDAELRKYGLS